MRVTERSTGPALRLKRRLRDKVKDVGDGGSVVSFIGRPCRPLLLHWWQLQIEYLIARGYPIGRNGSVDCRR